MGVGFARNVIDTWILWGAPTGEEGHGKVEAAPEEVDGTALADERRAVASPGLIGEDWPKLRSFPMLCITRGFHMLLHPFVPLLHCGAFHAVRLAA